MPPSKVFSHFRHHRRAGSTPSSPQPTQSFNSSEPTPTVAPTPVFESETEISPPTLARSTFSSTPPILPPIPRVASQKDSKKPPSGADRTSTDIVRQDLFADLARGQVSPPSATAPTLPPIPRVSSQGKKHSTDDETPVEDDTPLEDPTASQILEEKRNLPEPSIEQHPERLSRGISRARASWADFGRAFSSPQLPKPEQLKHPETPSASSHSHGHDVPFLQPQRQHASSPTSSISSFHKTASSTNLAIESSPASSRSAQGNPEKPVTARHSTRGKLNLLNPVSLLKRRRTSQVVESNTEGPVIPTRSMDLPVMSLPADYDPRIKGKVVHNFDAGTQPRRNWSATDMSGMTSQRTGDTGGPRRSSIPMSTDKPSNEDYSQQEREHAPVFVENFEEEEEGQTEGVSAVQRESLANHKFLARMSNQLNFDAHDFSGPLFPTKPSSEPSSSPSTVTQMPPTPPASQPAHQTRNSRNTDNSSFRISSDQSTARSSESNDTKATSPPQSPRKANSIRKAKTLDQPLQPSSQLSHLPSSASHTSRFSFQLNSDHCVEQEKALEEKHKQKQATRHSKHISNADSRFDEFDEEDVDYDDMFDDGDYEEEIPTMGGEEEIRTMGLNEQRLSSFSKTTGSVSVASPNEDTISGSSQRSQLQLMNENFPTTGDTVSQAVEDEKGAASYVQDSGHDSDFGDMYFDDGMINDETIEAIIGAGQGSFDESLLDSPVHSKYEDPSSTEDFPTPKRPQVSRDQVNDSSIKFDREIMNTETHHDDALGLVEEKTPTKLHSKRHEVQELPHEDPPGGLNAYHSALAEAASKAARDGKFTRNNSVMTTSSIYSSNPSLNEHRLSDAPGDDVDIIGRRQPLEDIDDEDDLMVAEANAEALASEDDFYYAQEFGFFRNPNTTSDGQLHSGGYFGQPNFLNTSLRQRVPAMTPISEKSNSAVGSKRNSVISPWGPPSAGAWGAPSSASQANTINPNLKDLAASMGMDDEEMTLSQLLRLRKEAFGQSGSGPQSAQPSSSSNDSSPTSQHNNNSSPLAGRGLSGSVMGGSLTSIVDHRRGSEHELPQVDEVPENVESDEGAVQDSPISEDVTLGTARAILSRTHGKQRRASAEILAKEYSNLLTDSPVPVIAKPIKPTPPTSPTQPSDASFGAPTVAGPSSPPILATPKPHKASTELATTNTATKASSPLSSPPIGSDRPVGSAAMPTPPMAMLQKFASRPAPDPYRKSGEPSQMQQHRRRSSAESDSGTSSVAYIRDLDKDGVERWFLERRKMKPNGELIVTGREPVELGGI